MISARIGTVEVFRYKNIERVKDASLLAQAIYPPNGGNHVLACVTTYHAPDLRAYLDWFPSHQLGTRPQYLVSRFFRVPQHYLPYAVYERPEFQVASAKRHRMDQSRLCDPSQSVPFLLCLQPQKNTFPSFSVV
jgi:hypothetical protein